MSLLVGVTTDGRWEIWDYEMGDVLVSIPVKPKRKAWWRRLWEMMK